LVPGLAFASPEEELSGLFLQSCMVFSGHPVSLRKWAETEKLPRVQDPARAAFLGGMPGQVFDASNTNGKFVVISRDDGGCSAVTDHAAGGVVKQALERMFARAGVTFRLVEELDDQVNKKLHRRNYLATRQGQSWHVQAATARDDAPAAQAMLSAAVSPPAK